LHTGKYNGIINGLKKLEEILNRKKIRATFFVTCDCIQKYPKISPKGFRAPQHSIDDETLNLLEKYNFKYDSSYSPWNFFHMILSRKKVKFSHNFTPKNLQNKKKSL